MKHILIPCIALVLSPVPLMAAPFCVRTQAVPAQCDYVDAGECQRRADQMGGECVANPSELKIKLGTGDYCVVYSSRIALCAYTDRTACHTEALRKNAACIETGGDGIQPDPYAYDSNRKY